jgi:hypothetical protein
VRNQGLHTDGFLFPTPAHRGVRYIKKVLDEIDLRTKFVSPEPTAGYSFVMLSDDEYDIQEVHENICRIFRGQPASSLTVSAQPM